MKFTRKAQLALTAVAAAAPLALALPAQTSTTNGLCTVTPWAPFFDHLDSSGQKVINYGTTVYCQSGRSIEIQDQRWDDDTWDFIPSADDPHGITTHTITFTSTSTSTVYESAAKALPDSDAWGTTTRRCTTPCASGSPATASRPRGRRGRTARWSRSTCDPQALAGIEDQERRERQARASPASRTRRRSTDSR